jgi:hypothetical protein
MTCHKRIPFTNSSKTHWKNLFSKQLSYYNRTHSTRQDGNSQSGVNLKNRKKTRFKKVYWLLAGLALLIVFFILLLLYRPGSYSPPELTNDKQVSPYLTHELLPKLYNDSQLGDPFDLFVSQAGVNEIIAHSKWPRQSGGIDFWAPVAFFLPGRVVLMGEGRVGGRNLLLVLWLSRNLMMGDCCTYGWRK